MISVSVYLRGGGSFNVLFTRPLSPMNHAVGSRTAAAESRCSVVRPLDFVCQSDDQTFSRAREKAFLIQWRLIDEGGSDSKQSTCTRWQQAAQHTSKAAARFVTAAMRLQRL